MGALCSERLNKSLEALDAAGFAVVLGGLDAKLKSPKSSLGMVKGFGFLGAMDEDLGAAAGLGVGLGVVSKKPPPLNGGEVS